MTEMHILLIDYTSGRNEYIEFGSQREARKFIEEELEPDEEVEYAQLIKAETLFSWSNPNCCPE